MPSNAFPELRRRLLAAGATLAFAFAGAPAAEAQIFGMS